MNYCTLVLLKLRKNHEIGSRGWYKNQFFVERSGFSVLDMLSHCILTHRNFLSSTSFLLINLLRGCATSIWPERCDRDNSEKNIILKHTSIPLGCVIGENVQWRAEIRRYFFNTWTVTNAFVLLLLVHLNRRNFGEKLTQFTSSHCIYNLTCVSWFDGIALKNFQEVENPDWPLTAVHGEVFMATCAQTRIMMVDTCKSVDYFKCMIGCINHGCHTCQKNSVEMKSKDFSFMNHQCCFVKHRIIAKWPMRHCAHETCMNPWVVNVRAPAANFAFSWFLLHTCKVTKLASINSNYKIHPLEATKKLKSEKAEADKLTQLIKDLTVEVRQTFITDSQNVL